jgi:hypothetical protein
MKGYEILTSDGESVGHVVAQAGDNLILEHGLFHTEHALPLEFVHVDHETKVAHTTLSKELIEGSPKLEHRHVDQQAVADYYGLSDTTVSDDQLAAGEEEEAAEEEDVYRGARAAPVGRPIIPPDSHT